MSISLLTYIMDCLDISIALSFVFNDWNERFLSNGTLAGVKGHDVFSPRSGIQSHGGTFVLTDLKLPYNFQLFSTTCLLSNWPIPFLLQKEEQRKSLPKDFDEREKRHFSFQSCLLAGGKHILCPAKKFCSHSGFDLWEDKTFYKENGKVS